MNKIDSNVVLSAAAQKSHPSSFPTRKAKATSKAF